MLNIDEKDLESLLGRKKDKIERAKFGGTSEIISAVVFAITLCLSDFSNVTIIPPLYFKIVTWIIALIMLAVGIRMLAQNIKKHYTVKKLYNEIVNLDPNIKLTNYKREDEHPFNIIIIKNNINGGYLQFKSKRWGCWLFPNYHCLDKNFDQKQEADSIIKHLKDNLGITVTADDIDYIGNEIDPKYSVPDEIYKFYNFHYFQVNRVERYSKRKRSFVYNGYKYSWKTLDQLYDNEDIVDKNKGVLDYVRKHCDIN